MLSCRTRSSAVTRANQYFSRSARGERTETREPGIMACFALHHCCITRVRNSQLCGSSENPQQDRAQNSQIGKLTNVNSSLST